MIETQRKSINWDAENTIFYIYFLFTVLVVYFVPNVWLIRLIFFPILIIIFLTKKDYFWLALFFLILDPPGSLFSAGLRESVQRIPIYPILGFSIGFTELVYLTFLVKAFSSNNNSDFLFKRQFRIFWFFGFILIFYSFLIGISPNAVVGIIRLLLPWSIVFSVSKLMNSEKKFYGFCKLIFPVAILIIGNQISVYFTGKNFNDLLGGNRVEFEDILVSTDKGFVIRTTGSGMILFFLTISALYYKVKNTGEFKSIYLTIIIFLSSLSVFLSATRGWILAYGLMFLLILILLPSNVIIKRIASVVIYGSFIYYILILAFPIVGSNFEASFTRFQTMGLFAKGDITAGGTLGRLDVRAPLVWDQAKESLLLGYGFSDNYLKHSDGHVGPLNIILNSGIIGAIILNFIFFSLIYSIWKKSSNRNIISSHGSSLKIFSMGLIGIYIIHSTSGQLWGYQIMNNGQLLYAFILGFVSAIVNTTNSNKKTTLPAHQYIIK